MNDGDVLIHSTLDAPWLPSGGSAYVFRSRVPPRPTSLVRLLVRRGGSVYCVPRGRSGALDLPTRAVPLWDLDGSATASDLASDVLGADSNIVWIGFVRNSVEQFEPDYEWPTPLAHFSVWQTHGAPIEDGIWVSTGGGSPLSARHWFPLVNEPN